MPKPQLPKRAVIGPFTYTITEDPKAWKRLAKKEADNCWGYTHHGSGTILIQPGMVADLRRAILLHELLHACAFAGGVLDTRKRREESWVAMVAPMLLDCLDRSPGLRKFLAKP